MHSPGEMGLTNSQHGSLERRPSLFATAPSQSPYLHSHNVDGSVFGSTMGKMYAGGPLQVKNAVEGDIPKETDSIHASIGPRHLGVEGRSHSRLVVYELIPQGTVLVYRGKRVIRRRGATPPHRSRRAGTVVPHSHHRQ